MDGFNGGASLSSDSVRNDLGNERNKVPEKYYFCPKCGAQGLEHLQIGGDGHWEDKIQCLECFDVRDVSYKDVIIPLIGEKYGLTREQVLKTELKSQRRYAESIDRDPSTVRVEALL